MVRRILQALYELFIEAPLGGLKAVLGEYVLPLALYVAYIAALVLALWVVLTPFGLGEWCGLGIYLGILGMAYLANKGFVPVKRERFRNDELDAEVNEEEAP